jgi:hypothetical protein
MEMGLLADGAAGEPAAQPEEDPAASAASLAAELAAAAEREEAEAQELLRQWHANRVEPGWRTPFDLTVQPVIGGEEAAITLKGVTSGHCTVRELYGRVQMQMPEMESQPHPLPQNGAIFYGQTRIDDQLLLIVNDGKGPPHDVTLQDETLPIGAYNVVPGVTLHLTMRDGDVAAARRLARVVLREQLRSRAIEKEERKQAVRQQAKLLGAGTTTVLLVLLIAYLSAGCGACENGAACNGLFGACVCIHNHLGEYCERSCGDFGQVVNSACVCSGNRTGTFCELGGPSELEDLDWWSLEAWQQSDWASGAPTWLITACYVIAIVDCCGLGLGAYIIHYLAQEDDAGYAGGIGWVDCYNGVGLSVCFIGSLAHDDDNWGYALFGAAILGGVVCSLFVLVALATVTGSWMVLVTLLAICCAGSVCGVCVMVVVNQ